jgi:uncharacterized membrane protein YfhO
VELSASVTQAGLLVLNDVWHPNWTVRVDGAERHLGEVNEAFRGVLLAPGKHVIEMSYAPKTLAIARVMSILGLATMLLLVLFRRRLDQRLTALIGRPQTNPGRFEAVQAGK